MWYLEYKQEASSLRKLPLQSLECFQIKHVKGWFSQYNAWQTRKRTWAKTPQHPYKRVECGWSYPQSCHKGLGQREGALQNCLGPSAQQVQGETLTQKIRWRDWRRCSTLTSGFLVRCTCVYMFLHTYTCLRHTYTQTGQSSSSESCVSFKSSFPQPNLLTRVCTANMEPERK